MDPMCVRQDLLRLRKDHAFCEQTDGTLSRSGELLIAALMTPATVEEAPKETGMPLFCIRNGARELLRAGFLKKIGGMYEITSEGIRKLQGKA